MARNKSIEAHERVIQAALDLIIDHGIEGTSVDAIAQRSGVSKATIYKHWKTKDEIFLEGIGRLSGDIPLFDTDDFRADLISFLSHFSERGKSNKLAKIWPKIIGSASGSAQLAKALRVRVLEKRKEQLLTLLRRGVSNHTFSKSLDLDFAADLLLGPILHRRIMTGTASKEFIQKLVDDFLKLALNQ